MRKEVNRGYALKLWPLGTKVRTVKGSVGTVMDVRSSMTQWWNYEYLIQRGKSLKGNPVDTWILEKDLRFADPWAEFERLLRRHDWTYEMSDDHRVWQSGRDARDVLNRTYKELCIIDEPRAIELWKKHEERLP